MFVDVAKGCSSMLLRLAEKCRSGHVPRVYLLLLFSEAEERGKGEGEEGILHIAMLRLDMFCISIDVSTIAIVHPGNLSSYVHPM